jgi:hypothetical protein
MAGLGGAPPDDVVRELGQLGVNAGLDGSATAEKARDAFKAYFTTHPVSEALLAELNKVLRNGLSGAFEIKSQPVVAREAPTAPIPQRDIWGDKGS